MLRESAESEARSLPAGASYPLDAEVESDELDQHLVREAVMSIDDQYVVACDRDGVISAGSTIADLLFDRHGSNSGRITDSLAGGRKVQNANHKRDHSFLKPFVYVCRLGRHSLATEWSCQLRAH